MCMIGISWINLYKSLQAETIPKSSSEGSGNYFRLIRDHLVIWYPTMPYHNILHHSKIIRDHLIIRRG